MVQKLRVAFNSTDKSFCLYKFMNRNAIYYTYSCMSSTAQRPPALACTQDAQNTVTYIYMYVRMAQDICSYIYVHLLPLNHQCQQDRPSYRSTRKRGRQSVRKWRTHVSLALLAAPMSCSLAKRLMVRMSNASSDWKTTKTMSKRHVKDVIGAMSCVSSVFSDRSMLWITVIQIIIRVELGKIK